MGQFHACSSTKIHSMEGKRRLSRGGRGARRERSTNATPSMSRLEVGRATVTTRVEGVSDPVCVNEPMGELERDWVNEVTDWYRA